MNCQDFDSLVDALLDATCSREEWAKAESHLAGCARCGRLFRGITGTGESLDETGRALLTSSVLERTSGGSCAAARARLCDLVDGALQGADEELMVAHLAHCAGCRSLASAMERAGRILPSFAELEAPARLLPGVLSATSRRHREPSLGDRMSAWLAGVARRPRISFEVAYVCTLLLAILFGDPVKAFKDTSARGIALAQPGVERVARRLAEPLSTARGVGARFVTGVGGSGSSVTEAASSARPATSLRGRFAGIWEWWDARVTRPLRAFLDRLAGLASSALEGVRALATKVASELPRRNDPPAAPGHAEPSGARSR